MSEPFLGEIQIFGFNFAPSSWAMCNGQVMPISQNTALFSLLGTFYGGDGRTTFGLPNLQGQAVNAVGQGPGLSPYVMGENVGSEMVTLQTTDIPSHNHTAYVFSQGDDTKRFAAPAANYAPCVPANISPFIVAQSTNGFFPINTLGNTGGGQAHSNQQPYMAMNFCIALEGIFPAHP